MLPVYASTAGPEIEKIYWHYWKQEFKGLSPEDYLANRIPERLRRKSDPRIYARLEAAVARWQKKTAEMYAELAKNPGDSVLRVKFLRANNGLANLENTLDVSVDERLTLAARTYRRTLAVDPSNGEALDMMKHIEAYFRRKNKPVPR